MKKVLGASITDSRGHDSSRWIPQSTISKAGDSSKLPLGDHSILLRTFDCSEFRLPQQKWVERSELQSMAYSTESSEL